MHHITGPKDNLLRLDVRLKIFLLLGMLALVVSYNGLVFPLIVLLVCLTAGLAMKLSLRACAFRLAEPLLMLLVLVAVKMLSGAEPLWEFRLMGYRFHVYADGLLSGAKIAARMMAAVAVVTVISLSTPFADFYHGLLWFKIPRSFIEVIMFAVRYVRMLYEEAMVIYHAQRNRLGYSSLLRSLNSFGMLAAGLVIKSFDHACETNVALKQRGYDGSIPVRDHKPFKAGELAVVSAFLAVLAGLWHLKLG